MGICLVAASHFSSVEAGIQCYWCVDISLMTSLTQRAKAAWAWWVLLHMQAVCIEHEEAMILQMQPGAQDGNIQLVLNACLPSQKELSSTRTQNE